LSADLQFEMMPSDPGQTNVRDLSVRDCLIHTPRITSESRESWELGGLRHVRQAETPKNMLSNLVNVVFDQRTCKTALRFRLLEVAS
jgi:hypothetical protein